MVQIRLNYFETKWYTKVTKMATERNFGRANMVISLNNSSHKGNKGLL